MEITIRLDYGPINAELSGQDGETVREELKQLLDLFDEDIDSISNESSLDREEIAEDDSQTSATTWAGSDSGSTVKTELSQSTETGASEFSSLATKTGVDAHSLSMLFELPEDEEGVPSLNMYHFDEGSLKLGNARNQRQSQAAALLLYVWEECLDEKRISFDKLDQALVNSDIETERRKDMTQAFSGDAGDWFESNGSQIYLIGKGKNRAREVMQELSVELN